MISRGDRRGFAFSFPWLFAIIVGAAIIFLAIYGSTKILRTGEFEQNTETAKKLTTLFEPLSSGTADGSSGRIKLTSPVRIYEDCFTDGNFGRQRFSTSEETTFSEGDFSNAGVGISVSNKYVFAQTPIEGKEFYYFTKKFSMPYDVADILMISSEEYCFVKPPTFVKEDIENLKLDEITLTESINECAQKNPRLSKENIVCFGNLGSECSIKVTDTSIQRDYTTGYIEREGTTDKNYYIQNLIYAAIIADNQNYECNTKRLSMRTSTLTAVYTEKSKLLSLRGICNSGLDSGLLRLNAYITQYYRSSASLAGMQAIAKTINQGGVCELW